jgi:hypothetical protein
LGLLLSTNSRSFAQKNKEFQLFENLSTDVISLSTEERSSSEESWFNAGTGPGNEAAEG